MIQDDSHSSGSINYETPVSQQSFVGTLLMVVILLGNIALGASANEQFSNHVRDLQINIMKVEGELNELSTMIDRKGKNATKEVERYVSFLSSFVSSSFNMLTNIH